MEVDQAVAVLVKEEAPAKGVVPGKEAARAKEGRDKEGRDKEDQEEARRAQDRVASEPTSLHIRAMMQYAYPSLKDWVTVCEQQTRTTGCI